jgi:transposase InsO family protein
MIQKPDCSNPMLWGRFRFSVVGSLLSSPPARGALKAALEDLAARTWTHPISGVPVQFSAVTIQRWYYTARREKDDPVGALRRAVRKDCGKVSLGPLLTERLFQQYRQHPHWSYQLHYDNLAATVKAYPMLGPLRSYSTVRRYMQAHGLVRKRRSAPKGRPGQQRAVQRRENREVRSYEAEYVGSLWHLDFHHGSLPVITPRGQWQHPLALGILDDCCRLCCHLQWYLSETAEDLVHGLSQAIQKRGLPRSLLSDSGSAMIAEEVREGLLELGIVHERTLPYSPYQNGKQERFWATLEGRLMEMLAGVKDLTLEFLNEATQAWVEIEYNRTVHRELGCSPVERFAQARDVLRDSPSSNALRQAFRLRARRRQRQSDGTISLEGVRFEIPGRYRHFQDVVVRYARWDLSRVDLVDPQQGAILAPLYPLDRQANADGQRLLFDLDRPHGRTEDQPPADDRADEDRPAQEQPGQERGQKELPPLLKQILAEYSATGIPPAYLPKNPPKPLPEERGDT